MYRLIILTFFMMAVGGVKAQTAWQSLDSLTYRLYEDKEWRPLLKEAHGSFRDGIDFYYLRVRAGIAAYELKNYRLAVSHLSKAYQWNSSDEFVQFWYYMALVMSGRSDEARILASGFSEDFIQRYQISPVRGVNSVGAESQMTINTDYDGLLDESIAEADSYVGYRNVLRRQLYTGITLDHEVKPRFYAFHGVSHLEIQRMQMIQTPSRNVSLHEESRTSQNQYYLQGRYYGGKGWNLYSSVNLIWGHASSNWVSYTSAGIPVMNDYRYSISDRLWNFGIARELRFFRPKVSLTTANINDYTQTQVNGQLVLYPFGNTHFYTVTDVALHRDQSTEQTKTVWNQKVGLKTGPLWWIAEATSGDMKNFSVSDGYVVYNQPETITGLYGMTAYIPLFKYRLNLTARYQVLNKEGTIFDYSSSTVYAIKNYSFTDNNFLISLKWNL